LIGLSSGYMRYRCVIYPNINYSEPPGFTVLIALATFWLLMLSQVHFGQMILQDKK